MSRLDDLPPDQRAVLLLLVRQGKSHAEIAEMLGIPQHTVRDRARAALDALADEPGEPPNPARAPAPGGGGQTRASGGAPAPAAAVPPPPAPEQTRATPPTRDTGFSSSLPSSRRGGALLLAALVAIVVVAVILITSGGGSHKASSSKTESTAGATTSTPSTSTTATTSGASAKAGKPTLDKQIALTSPSEPNSKTVGLVEVLSEGSKRAFYIAAEHLPPSTGFFYAVWLYNSPTSSLPLGKIPPVGSNGQAQGGALLPANAGDYHEILLTRETNSRATQPGQVVLSGAFSLGGH
jgi:hypothetical protein